MPHDLIPGAEFVDNVNQRTPCLLILDGSASMLRNDNIQLLNEGVRQLQYELQSDPLARNRVQIAIILCSGTSPKLLTDWTDASEFSAPQLDADGETPLGESVAMGLRMIDERKNLYRHNAIPYTRPWMFIISDGAPTDIDWEKKALLCQQSEKNKQVLVWSIGVIGADLTKLAAFKAPNAEGKQVIFRLDGMKFTELFLWLSSSLSRTSQATAHNKISLLAPPARMIQIET